MNTATKIAGTAALLPFLYVGLGVLCWVVPAFRYAVLSGRFIRDQTIVTGGALNQGGLLKCGVALFFNFAFAVSLCALRRMWLRGLPEICTKVFYAAVAALLVMELGLLASYHWYLVRYILAMGFTAWRVVGLVCGGALLAGSVALFMKSAACALGRPSQKE